MARKKDTDKEKDDSLKKDQEVDKADIKASGEKKDKPKKMDTPGVKREKTSEGKNNKKGIVESKLEKKTGDKVKKPDGKRKPKDKAASFSIFRFDPEDGKTAHFQTYSMRCPEGMTVLSALLKIQDSIDGSLAFRSCCRAGICGSCAMHINGRYRLACETQVSHHCANKVTIRPLGHMPIIKDLMVDMAPFWEKYESIKPYLIPGNDEPYEIRAMKGEDGKEVLARLPKERIQSRDERARLTGIIDCIMCASCHAACSMTGTDPDYLGPAALAKAARFVLDSRDNAYNERLELVGGDHGVWRCHTIYACQEVCPKDIDPTGAIAELKRNLICPVKK